jgi:minor extracellular serine protease Vpr
VNAASGRLAPATGLAPGSIVSITGRGLSEFTLTAAGPGLPLSLGGISVSFDDKASGVSVPGRMLYVSDSRVDVQLPWELDGLASVQTKVSVDGFTSTTLATVPLANYSPAFWTRQDPDTGQIWVDAVDEAGNRLRAANRAVKGGLIRLYVNGLGMVDPTPASGDPASAELPSVPRGSINVQIAGRDIPVESARLLPGAVGIYEVSVRLPADLPGGPQTAVISAGGILSPEARLPIQD